MDSLWVVLIVARYMVALAAISFFARRSSRTSQSFASGGRVFPSILIGFLLMSEFIGTSTTIGTAQQAYSVGISAAWNVIALAIGFVLFSTLLAKKFKSLGENTISGALARTYGESVRAATSVLMICALLIVAVAIYASGGAILSSLLGINRHWAIDIVGVLATLYVTIGGMRSVVYTKGGLHLGTPRVVCVGQKASCAKGVRGSPAQRQSSRSVSYTHLTLPTSDLV